MAELIDIESVSEKTADLMKDDWTVQTLAKASVDDIMNKKYSGMNKGRAEIIITSAKNLIRNEKESFEDIDVESVTPTSVPSSDIQKSVRVQRIEASQVK